MSLSHIHMKVNLADYIQYTERERAHYTVILANRHCDWQYVLFTLSFDELCSFVSHFTKHAPDKPCLYSDFDRHFDKFYGPITIYPDFFENGEMLEEIYKNQDTQIVFDALAKVAKDYIINYRKAVRTHTVP